MEPELLEEFRVGGQRALDAEVFFGFDEADSEELGPNAVDGDARGERVVASDEPVSQCETIRGAFFE